MPQNIDEFISKAIRDSSFTCKEYKEKTNRQLIVDGAALTTLLIDSGYEPIEALKLLSKMYGNIVGTLPENMRDQDGNEITKELLENNFFDHCTKEKDISSFRSVENKGMVH